MPQGVNREVSEFCLAQQLRPHPTSEVVRVYRVACFVDEHPRRHFAPPALEGLFLPLHDIPRHLLLTAIRKPRRKVRSPTILKASSFTSRSSYFL